MRSWIVARLGSDGSRSNADVVLDCGEDPAAAVAESRHRGAGYIVRISDDGRVREPTDAEYGEMTKVLMGDG